MIEILVVEDSKVAQQKLKSDLAKLDFKVIGVVSSGEKAIKFVEKRQPDLIIMDIILDGDLDGLTTAKKITNKFNIPIVYLTEKNEDYVDLPSASAYLAKPFSQNELNNNINIVLEKHEIEEDLRKNKQFLENIFNSIKAGITVLDKQLNIVRTNPWIRDLYNGIDSLVGKKCYEVYNHRNKPCSDCPVIATLKSGQSHSGELRTKDGKWLELFAYPLKDESGDINGVIEYANDITERKEVEEELNQVNDIIQSSPAIVFKWRNEAGWKVEFVSKNIEQFGYSKEEFLAGEVVFSDIVYQNDLPRVEEEVSDNVKQGNDRFKQQYRVITANNEIRWIDDWTIIIRNDSGEVTHFHGIIIDVTDRINAEQKIRDNQRRWKFALESSQYGIWDWNLETGEVYFSPIWKKMLGYDEDELSSDVSEWSSRVHSDDLEEAKQDIERHLAGATDYYHNEHRMKHKDGYYIWIKDRGKVVEWTADGEPLRFIGTHEDITEKKEMEKKLKEREERLNLAMDAAEHGFWDWDLDADDVYFSPRYYRMLGYEPDEFSASFEKWASLLHPMDRKRVMNEIKEKIKQGIPFEKEFRLKTKSGKWKWIVGKGNSYDLDGEGRPHRAVGTVSDITERKEIEEKLKKNEKRYRGLIESQQDLIVRVNTDNKFTYVNDVYCETFGKKREELIGSSFTPLIHEDDREATLAAMKELKSPPYRAYIEQRAMTVDGWRWIAWEDYAIRNEAGEITEIQAVGRDITDLKEAQQKAEAANQAKSEFLANMSHEIRTPLSAVIGFSELLENMTDNQKQLKYLDSIKTAGNSLLTLINDILDLSKIEAGQLNINYKKFDLIVLLKEIKQIFLKKAQGKNLDFNLILPEKQLSIRLDETRLRQILLNLVGNAVKFTKQGYIKLKAEYRNQSEQKLNLELVVEDSGIGISKDEQENIFKAFKQQDGQSTREYGGTGLGLAITKRLTEMMDGSLTLESEEGVGSTFKIQFSDVEYSQSKVREKEENLSVNFKSASVLVVDDIESNRKLVTALLKELAIEVTAVESGSKAIEITNLAKFDLILMDLKMPKMDGYQATEKIKQDSLNQETPIVALTADVTTKVKERVEANDFSAFVAKPIEKKQLIKVLADYLNHDKVEKRDFNQEAKVDKKSNIQLSEVIEKLETEFIPWHEQIGKVFIINDVEEFASKLYELGVNYQIDLIINYAQNLKNKATNFNLKEVRSQFAKFEDLITRLK